MTLYYLFNTLIPVRSFGILFYEFWTNGAVPYGDLSNQQTKVKVLSGYRLPRPATCSEEVYQVMLQCWQSEPVHRPDFQTIVGTLLQLNLEIARYYCINIIFYQFIHSVPLKQLIEHQGTLYSILSLVEHQGTLYSTISLVEHQGTLYSILSLVEHQGTLYSIISLVDHQGTLYSIISLVEHQGTVEISSPYPEFVLTGVIKY